MCRQKLRNEVPAAGKPALSCHPSSRRNRPLSCTTFRECTVAPYWISLLQWSFSGGSKTKPDTSGGRFTLRHGSAAVIAASLLRATSTYRDDVRPLAESLGCRKSSTNEGRNSA